MFYIISFRNIDTNTLEGLRALIDRFVNSVVVYDDEILINLNYKGSTKRVWIYHLYSDHFEYS